MTIHAIVWDLGGVLVRTEDRQPRQDLAARLGMRTRDLMAMVWGDETDNRAQLGQITWEEHWENIRVELGLTPEELPGAQDQFFAGDVLDTELVEFIRGLKSDYTVALLSNALSNLRHMLFEEWKIEDAFHQLIISAEVGLMKPDPAIYALTLERIGFEPAEAVFIDDFKHNIAAAKDAGMHGIHFQTPEQAKAELMSLLE